TPDTPQSRLAAQVKDLAAASGEALGSGTLRALGDLAPRFVPPPYPGRPVMMAAPAVMRAGPPPSPPEPGLDAISFDLAAPVHYEAEEEEAGGMLFEPVLGTSAPAPVRAAAPAPPSAPRPAPRTLADEPEVLFAGLVDVDGRAELAVRTGAGVADY